MTQQTSGEAGREGLYTALKNSIATLISIGKTRAELLVTEIEEEKYRLKILGSKAIGAAFFLGMAVVMTVFCLATLFWEQRVLVFGLFAALFGLLAVILVSSLNQQAKQPSKLFRASLTELEADMAQLRRYSKKPE
jgi:uncharacterized membrane protein YqjE